MTEHTSQVGEELRRGALWSTISRFATRFILFGTTIVLARVLSPSDFGIVALGMVVWSLAGLFADLGVSASLIQAKDHIEEQANASFWLNLFIGGGLTLLTFWVAPLVGRFYDNDLVVPILRVQGLSFMLNGFATVQSVLLTKKMAFKELARVEIITGFSERILALVLAFTGFAAWSLVVPSIFIIPIRTFLLWRTSSFRPRLDLGHEQWSRIFHFGKHVFATTLLRYININGDYFVIGKVMGSAPLGIYTFAYNLANWPIENIVWVINKISFPAFAKLQEAPEELRRIYRQIIQSVSLLAFPIMMGMFAVADQLVIQIYGSKWQEGILPLKIIIGFMLIRTIASPGGGVLMALGKPKIEFHFNLVQLPLLLTANVFFVGSMALTLYLHQVKLPDDTTLYPIFAPSTPLLAHATFALMLLTFPVLLLDLGVLLLGVQGSRPSFRALSVSFLIGSVFLAAMIFAHILTAVYDYFPVIGPPFRDRFWLVHLLAGLAVLGPTMLARRWNSTQQEAWNGKAGTALSGFILTLGAVAVVAALMKDPSPVTPANPGNKLTVFTYNIQQGYSKDGIRSFDEQLAVIRSMDPDIVGLQETDTNRIAGGNNDLVRYYANKLNMYSYYGPSPVTGTFGVALLSKYPILDPRSFFLYSHSPGSHQKDQTAAIRAEIKVGDRTFTVVVTHLGNSGLAIQQASVLKAVEGRDNVIVMGDFNSRPGEEGYALTVQTLDDAWLLAAGGNASGREVDAGRRIDHIFVSRGMTVR